jgi:hypothetical protein
MRVASLERIMGKYHRSGGCQRKKRMSGAMWALVGKNTSPNAKAPGVSGHGGDKIDF